MFRFRWRAMAVAGTVVVAAAAAAVFWITSTASACAGVSLLPGEDIQGAIDAREAGTTFCLGQGTFDVDSNLSPKDHTVLVGAGIEKTLLVGTGATIVIDASGTDGVTIRDMSISGGLGTPECKPQCGTGFKGGTSSTIQSVRLHHNANHGVGGSEEELVIEDSILDHNGSEGFVGCCAGGVKGGVGFVIRDSHVHSNVGNGIWCDSGCPGGLVATGNVVEGNSLDGIRYEVSSSGAIIQDNIVEGNNTSGSLGGHGGITIVASSNALVVGNRLGGNQHAGIIVRATPRGEPSDITIFRNSLEGDELLGCDEEGATCRDNG
jgi:hypothetical protein